MTQSMAGNNVVKRDIYLMKTLKKRKKKKGGGKLNFLLIHTKAHQSV